MKKLRGHRAKQSRETNIESSAGPREEAERAFIRLQPDRAALGPEELIKPNVDMARAVGVVLAAAPIVAELVPQMRRLPDFEPELVDGLRDVALAAGYANAVFVAPPRDTSVKALVSEARILQRRLRDRAAALAEIELLDAEAVAAIRAARTQRGLANNLIALAHLFRERWKTLDGKTRVDEQTVERAADVGVKLIEALGSRDLAKPSSSEAYDARVRAFTLLVKRYDQVRRAVTFLRWNDGDSDELAPSIYMFRGGRRAPRALETPTPPPVE